MCLMIGRGKSYTPVMQKRRQANNLNNHALNCCNLAQYAIAGCPDSDYTAVTLAQSPTLAFRLGDHAAEVSAV